MFAELRAEPLLGVLGDTEPLSGFEKLRPHLLLSLPALPQLFLQLRVPPLKHLVFERGRRPRL